jgi:hypothetical protein
MPEQSRNADPKWHTSDTGPLLTSTPEKGEAVALAGAHGFDDCLSELVGAKGITLSEGRHPIIAMHVGLRHVPELGDAA